MTADVFHLGLMAELNDAFNPDDAPEIDFYRDVVECHGGPVLDLGCGPGRLLRRCRASGVEIEGADVSPDMLAICRRRCRAAGFEPVLHAQGAAQLDLPRRYRLIVMCGAFGLNGTRADDLEALRRIRRHLEPGGSLVFDSEPGWMDARAWARFAEPQRLPSPWRVGGRTATRDGGEIVTEERHVGVDRVEMSLTREVRCHLVRDGATLRSELHRLVVRFYGVGELLLLLEHAGFADAAFGEEVLWEGLPMPVYRARRPLSP